MAKRAAVECCLCSQPSLALGRCQQHYADVKRDPVEWARLKHLSREALAEECRLLKYPPIPKWTYEPTERQIEDLIKTYGQQSKRHVRVGAA
jgi:hypothetical protein